MLLLNYKRAETCMELTQGPAACVQPLCCHLHVSRGLGPQGQGCGRGSQPGARSWDHASARSPRLLPQDSSNTSLSSCDEKLQTHSKVEGIAQWTPCAPLQGPPLTRCPRSIQYTSKFWTCSEVRVSYLLKALTALDLSCVGIQRLMPQNW